MELLTTTYDIKQKYFRNQENIEWFGFILVFI